MEYASAQGRLSTDKKLNAKIQSLEKRFTDLISTKVISTKPKKYASLTHNEKSDLRSTDKGFGRGANIQTSCKN